MSIIATNKLIFGAQVWSGHSGNEPDDRDGKEEGEWEQQQGDQPPPLTPAREEEGGGTR